MSYQALARKWRPNNFSELVGQEHVVSAISNALDNDRLHHAYLFSGTRGVGKTTIARIFSKSLNCEQGIGSKPCGQCSTCVEIEQGNFVDLLEIDAASRTKVEDTRELLDNVQYRPTRGRYKVYLIDEVHMLSKHSFNALLKTLEEPPPHVKFLLATTDPQKLPVTILSRCLQFNLKALSRAQISQQLQHILQQEGIPSEAESIAQLARAAQGSMRDSLSLTDQAIAQGNGQISVQVVTDMLGLMDKNQVLKLLNGVVQKDTQVVMAMVEQMSFQAPDYAQILAELMSLLHQIALTQFVPDACKLETIAARAIYQMAKGIPAEQVQLLYQIALQGKKDIAFAPDGRTGLEMTLLRMLAFSPTGLSLGSADISDFVTAENSASSSALSSVPDTQPVIKTESEPELSALNQAPEMANSYSELQTTEAHDLPEPDNSQLFAQQDNLLQQAEDLHPQMQHYAADTSAPVVIPGYDASGAAQPDMQEDYEQQHVESTHQSIDNEPQGEAPPASPTESLLALKRKLSAPQNPPQEQSSPVKKSEAEVDLQSAEGQVQPPLATKRDTPSEEDEQQSIELVSDWPAAAAEENDTEFQQQPPPVSEQQSDMPPWPLNEQPAKLNQPEQVIAEVEFDSTAHLNEEVGFEVDFDIPAFLSSGEKVVHAAQLDSWSNLIEQMQVTALTKQLALHSGYELQNNVVILCLPEAKQHLNTESARNQLQQALSQALQQNIELTVETGNAINTPFAVQQNVNLVRQGYAEKVVESDESFVRLLQTFAAEVVEQSIKPR